MADNSVLKVSLDMKLFQPVFDFFTGINKMLSARDIIRQLKIMNKISFVEIDNSTAYLNELLADLKKEVEGEKVRLDYRVTLSNDLFASEIEGVKRSGIYVDQHGNFTAILNVVVDEFQEVRPKIKHHNKYHLLWDK